MPGRVDMEPARPDRPAPNKSHPNTRSTSQHSDGSVLGEADRLVAEPEDLDHDGARQPCTETRSDLTHAAPPQPKVSPDSTPRGLAKSLATHSVHVLLRTSLSRLSAILERLWTYLCYADGRDKFFKVIQYTLKLYLLTPAFQRILTHASSPIRGAAKGDTPPDPRVKKLVSQLSLFRKMIRLLHVVQPLGELVAAVVQGGSWDRERVVDAVNAGLGCVNDVCDDAVTLIKMGMVRNPSYPASTSAPTPRPSLPRSLLPTPTSRLDTLEYLSTSLWLSTIILDLRAAIRGRAWEQPGKKRWSMIKLLADGVFCSYDVWDMYGWNVRVERGPVLAGLVSAMIGTWKVWIKC